MRGYKVLMLVIMFVLFSAVSIANNHRASDRCGSAANLRLGNTILELLGEHDTDWYKLIDANNGKVGVILDILTPGRDGVLSIWYGCDTNDQPKELILKCDQGWGDKRCIFKLEKTAEKYYLKIFADNGYPTDYNISAIQVTAPDCDDTFSNDNDTRIDYPDDPGCDLPEDNDERSSAIQCDDGIDNDGDGRADFSKDPKCEAPNDNDEFSGNNPVDIQCKDGIDNDGDGDIDSRDSGCLFDVDITELKDIACDDGLDNDTDGLTDFPDDKGCSNNDDNDESGGSTKTECNDGEDNDGDGLTDYQNDFGCSSSSDDTETSPSLICDNGRDESNDADALADYRLSGGDPGCVSVTDTSEIDGQCDDTTDNDGDGLTDYPSDPGCSSYSDNDETDPIITQCNDNADNDNDGYTDFGSAPTDDPGCISELDDSELGTNECDNGFDDGDADNLADAGDYACFGNPAGASEIDGACDNNADDDNDSFIDYPNDPGCAGFNDGTEKGSLQCDDGKDNDRDGKVDLNDEACENPYGDDEETLLEKYAPVLYFHPDEKYYPTTIDAMLENSKLYKFIYYAPERDSPAYDIKEGPLAITDLTGSDVSLGSYIDLTTSRRNWLKCYSPYLISNPLISLILSILFDCEFDLYKDDSYFSKYRPTVYAKTDRIGDFIVLQYWFFYVFNDFSSSTITGADLLSDIIALVNGRWEKINEIKNLLMLLITLEVSPHEGDWELVQVVLDSSNNNPIDVTYAQHFYGQTYDWNKIEVNNTTHPVVYVALGSHASYKGYEPVQDLIGENISDTKKIVLTKDSYNLELVDDTTPWIHSKTKWGEIDIFPIWDFLGNPPSGWPQPYFPLGLLYTLGRPFSPGLQSIKWNESLLWREESKRTRLCFNGLLQIDEDSFVKCIIEYIPDELIESIPDVISDIIAVFAHSPVNLHAYDSQGRHTGLNENGGIEAEIPGTFVYIPSENDSEIMIMFTKDDIRFEIEATDGGEFDLDVRRYTNSTGTGLILAYKDVQIEHDTKAVVTVASGGNYEMNIDLDGDGDFDSTKKPDECIGLTCPQPPNSNNAVNNGISSGGSGGGGGGGGRGGRIYYSKNPTIIIPKKETVENRANVIVKDESKVVEKKELEEVNLEPKGYAEEEKIAKTEIKQKEKQKITLSKEAVKNLFSFSTIVAGFLMLTATSVSIYRRHF